MYETSQKIIVYTYLKATSESVVEWVYICESTTAKKIIVLNRQYLRLSTLWPRSDQRNATQNYTAKKWTTEEESDSKTKEWTHREHNLAKMRGIFSVSHFCIASKRSSSMNSIFFFHSWSVPLLSALRPIHDIPHEICDHFFFWFCAPPLRIFIL